MRKKLPTGSIFRSRTFSHCRPWSGVGDAVPSQPKATTISAFIIQRLTPLAIFKPKEGPAKVATFASYADSLKSFVALSASLVQGKSDPEAFAAELQNSR